MHKEYWQRILKKMVLGRSKSLSENSMKVSFKETDLMEFGELKFIDPVLVLVFRPS
jgi:hypothetical protein